MSQERIDCPECGGVIVLDETARLSHHEAPPCSWYLKACEDLGAKLVPHTREFSDDELARMPWLKGAPS